MQLGYSNYFSIYNNNQKLNIDQSRIDSDNVYSLITHSHSDHVTNTSQKTFATKETISLINSILYNNKFNFESLDYNKKIKLTDDVSLTTLNAGHILGSAMFYFETDNKTILYTGDLNTQKTLLLNPARPVHADILIIESTFGRKDFIFKNRFDIYSELERKIKKDIYNNKFVILGGYSLGKNQELIAFVNKYINEIPLVDKKTYEISKIYQKCGLNLGDYFLLNQNLSSSNILIMPLHLINRNFINSLKLQTRKDISSYVVTGWNYSRSSTIVNISDHLDYNNILNFVAEVNPEKVYTIHGFTEELARDINYKLGIDAKSINNITKKELVDI